MANQTLIVSAIGDDRPGLVEALATTISSHGGNWLDASMAHHSGKFAGIVTVAVPAEAVAALSAALQSTPGLKIAVEPAGAATPAVQPRRRLTLSLVGHDRPGIVAEVSQVLARRRVNVEKLETRAASAPMSAEMLFHYDAELSAAVDLDAAALKGELEQLSNELMVELHLGVAL